jgi:hypothetical protein
MGKVRRGNEALFRSLAFAVPVFAQQHDLLLKGGHLRRYGDSAAEVTA